MQTLCLAVISKPLQQRQEIQILLRRQALLNAKDAGGVLHSFSANA